MKKLSIDTLCGGLLLIWIRPERVASGNSSNRTCGAVGKAIGFELGIGLRYLSIPSLRHRNSDASVLKFVCPISGSAVLLVIIQR